MSENITESVYCDDTPEEGDLAIFGGNVAMILDDKELED